MVWQKLKKDTGQKNQGRRNANLGNTGVKEKHQHGPVFQEGTHLRSRLVNFGLTVVVGNNLSVMPGTALSGAPLELQKVGLPSNYFGNHAMTRRYPHSHTNIIHVVPVPLSWAN